MTLRELRRGEVPGHETPLKEISAAAGISIASLSRIERGKQACDPGTLKRIALALGVTYDVALEAYRETVGV